MIQVQDKVRPSAARATRHRFSLRIVEHVSHLRHVDDETMRCNALASHGMLGATARYVPALMKGLFQYILPSARRCQAKKQASVSMLPLLCYWQLWTCIKHVPLQCSDWCQVLRMHWGGNSKSSLHAALPDNFMQFRSSLMKI